MAKGQRSAVVAESSGGEGDWILARGGAVLVLGGVVWLVIVLAYAGPMAAVALFELILDGGVLVLWLGAAIGIGLLLLRPFGAIDDSLPARLLKYVTAAGLGLGAISLATLGLGLLGVLNQVVAIAIVAAGMAALVAELARHSSEIDAFKIWSRARARWEWLGLLGVPAFAMMTVGAMLPPWVLWRPEPHAYDVVEYHFQVPREWYEAGRIFALQHNVFSYLPFNVEMHYLLAMHLRGGPWAGMYLAQFMHGAFVVLSVVAVGAFASRLFKRPGAAVVAMLAASGAPMMWQLGAIGYVEGGFLFFAVLSIGWTLVALSESKVRVGQMVLAGVMAGLGCGAKLTALPEVLVAVPVIAGLGLFVWPGFRGESISRRLGGLAIFGLMGLLTFSPWLVRTAAWAGNPVFPEMLRLGHGRFTEAQVERWEKSLQPREDQKSVAGRLEAGWEQVGRNWQFGFLLIPAAIIGMGMKRRDRNVQFLGALFLGLCVFWLAFTHLQARFFILAVPVCAMVVATMPRAMLPVVIVELVIGSVMLHLNLTTVANQPWADVVNLLGTEDLTKLFTPAAVSDIPKDASVVLIGDGRAFLYQIPMSKLRYRTVFDVDDSGGKSLVDAFAGKVEPGTYLVIDPNELRRFEKTYQPFPKVPAELSARDGIFVVRKDDSPPRR